MQPIHSQRRDAQLAGQWLDIAQDELHPSQCQQRLVFGVVQHKILGADLPRHGHRRQAGLGDAELECQVGRNTAPGHAHRQAAGR